MLVLSRRVGEEVVIGENIRLRVVATVGGRVKLAIEAPRSINIRRSEVVPMMDSISHFESAPPQPLALAAK
jgi:carbon storage regulator CsrA